MTHTLPTSAERAPKESLSAGAQEAQIRAEVKSLLAAEELPVQEVTHKLRHRFSSELIITVITEMIRSGRIHMTEGYPIRLRLRVRSQA